VDRFGFGPGKSRRVRQGHKAAALLHDTIEDTETNYDELRGQFGARIADKICNLRDILGSPPVKWTPERKQKYFEDAKLVVDEVRDANPALAGRFDRLYAYWLRRRAGKTKSGQSARKERSGDPRPVQLEPDAKRKKFEEVAKMIAKVHKKA